MLSRTVPASALGFPDTSILEELCWLSCRFHLPPGFFFLVMVFRLCSIRHYLGSSPWLSALILLTKELLIFPLLSSPNLDPTLHPTRLRQDHDTFLLSIAQIRKGGHLTHRKQCTKLCWVCDLETGKFSLESGLLGILHKRYQVHISP